MGCLGLLLELFGLEVVLEAIWKWLSSLTFRRRPDVPEREKPSRPDPPKRISRGGRR